MYVSVLGPLVDKANVDIWMTTKGHTQQITFAIECSL